MGCHTWVYKKVSALTDDEKVKIVENNEDFYINHWWAEKLTVDELEVQVKEWYEEQPEVYENRGTPREYAEQIIKEHADSRKQYNEDPWKYFLEKHKNDYPVCFECEEPS